jgi:hypothetical protein
LGSDFDFDFDFDSGFEFDRWIGGRGELDVDRLEVPRNFLLMMVVLLTVA